MVFKVTCGILGNFYLATWITELPSYVHTPSIFIRLVIKSTIDPYIISFFICVPYVSINNINMFYKNLSKWSRIFKEIVLGHS